MKAIFALLASVALTNAVTFNYYPFYQAYYVNYMGATCAVSNVTMIELYSSVDDGYYSKTIGTGHNTINDVCYAGTKCTSYTYHSSTSSVSHGSVVSYEIVCVTGSPVNLGMMAVELEGPCSSISVPPFKDYYYYDGYTGTGHTFTTKTYGTIENRIQTWRDGCWGESDAGAGYYGYNSVMISSSGCSAYTDGICKFNSKGMCNCTDASGLSYKLATGTSGCDTATTSSYYWLECNTATFSTSTYKTVADFFALDDKFVMFNLGECAAGCESPMIGDGHCQIECDVAACDNDGGDCCVPASTSSCCTPVELAAPGAPNVCCDVAAADMTNNQNNLWYAQVMESCICDGINSNLGLKSQATLDASGVCVYPSTYAQTKFSTATDAKDACDFAKIISWCHAHALKYKTYTTDVLPKSATTWIKAEQKLTSKNGMNPLPGCLGIGGQYTTTAESALGGAEGICTGVIAVITLAGQTCDAVCSSASTFAISALLALLF